METTTREPGPGPDPVLDPVTRVSVLASGEADPAAGLSGLSGLSELPGLAGLAGRLAAMAAELRLLARSFRNWGLPEAGVGDAIGRAQAVREAAHAVSAVLAGEVTSRGLGSREGLTRNDWVAAHAPALEGARAAVLTTVGAVLGRGGNKRRNLKVECSERKNCECGFDRRSQSEQIGREPAALQTSSSDQTSNSSPHQQGVTHGTCGRNRPRYDQLGRRRPRGRRADDHHER